jgi:hypothetical protein
MWRVEYSPYFTVIKHLKFLDFVEKFSLYQKKKSVTHHKM